MGPINNKATFGSGNGLAPKRRQAIIWTNADPVHRRIYAALGGNEFKCQLRKSSGTPLPSLVAKGLSTIYDIKLIVLCRSFYWLTPL